MAISIDMFINRFITTETFTAVQLKSMTGQLWTLISLIFFSEIGGMKLLAIDM